MRGWIRSWEAACVMAAWKVSMGAAWLAVWAAWAGRVGGTEGAMDATGRGEANQRYTTGTQVCGDWAPTRCCIA